MSKKYGSLVYGTVILTVSSFINRILGFLYRVMTVRLIGTEGVGLFQMIIPLYSFLLVLTTAGIPLTLSKLISQQMALNKPTEAKRIFVVALRVLIVSSIIICSISFMCAPYLTKIFFSDLRIYWAYLTLLPALIVVAFSSAYRGYFLGLKRMFPTALSTLIEQVIRFIVGISTIYLLLPYGLEYSIVGLALGIVSGEVAGLMVLIIFYKINNISPNRANMDMQKKSWEIVKDIYSLSIPLTLGRAVTGLLFTAQAIIIPSRLHAVGYSLSDAASLFGQFTGIAMTLVGLPTIITVSLAITMVPGISEAMAADNIILVKKRARTAIKITVLAGLPWIVIFYTIPGQLCGTIFGTPEAGIPLKYLAVGAFFAYLQQTSMGIIQGMGKMYILLLHSVIGAVINLSGIYLLTGTLLGIKGTAIAFNLSSMVVASLNLLYVSDVIKFRIKYKKLLLLIITIIIMIISMISSSHYFAMFGNSIGLTVLNLLLGVTIYSICLFVLGFISLNDLKMYKRIL